MNRYLWLHLSNKAIHCDYWDRGCAEVVSLSNLCQHAMTCRFGKPEVTKEPQIRADEKPSEPMVQGNQADTTKCIADVLAAPVTQPISGTEQKLLGGLLRRLSHQHQSQFGLPVYTGGCPAHISFTPIATALDNTSVSDLAKTSANFAGN